MANLERQEQAHGRQFVLVEDDGSITIYQGLYTRINIPAEARRAIVEAGDASFYDLRNKG